VRTGAIAEASVRVIFEDELSIDAPVKTETPAFVQILQTRVGTQDRGRSGTCLFCDLFISVDTSRAGQFNDKIRLAVADERVAVPIEMTVLEPEPGRSRVPVVESPFVRFSGRAADFKAWLELVTSAKLDVHYLVVDRQKGAADEKPVLRDLELSKYDVVLLGCGGLYYALPEDLRRLGDFVQTGGRVIVAANHFFMKTVDRTNEFVVPFGLSMADTEPAPDRSHSSPGAALEIAGSDIAPHHLTEGIRKLRFFRPSPVFVTDATKGQILVEAPPFEEGGFVAVTRVGEGEIVVLGTSLWWNWIGSDRESGADNAELLKNLLVKPMPK
jgi:hypothetical protein